MMSKHNCRKKTMLMGVFKKKEKRMFSISSNAESRFNLQESKRLDTEKLDSQQQTTMTWLIHSLIFRSWLYFEWGTTFMHVDDAPDTSKV